MAQILVTGLAEVLRDHEDKIAAAQAWCLQQNIRSIDELKEKGTAAVDAFVGAIDELKSRGDAAADAFVKAAGAIKMLDEFIIKRRIGEYQSPPPAAPTPSPPLWATTEPKPAPYELLFQRGGDPRRDAHSRTDPRPQMEPR